MVAVAVGSEAIRRATELHDRATAQIVRSRLDLAGRRLGQALELLAGVSAELTDEATRVTVRVLITSATLEAELHGGEAGRDELVRAAELATRIGDPRLLFAVESTFALRMLRRGDHREALRYYTSAEANITSAGTRDACVLYLNRGNVRLQQLELGEARRDLDRCIALAVLDPDPALRRIEFMARHNLGYLEFLAGNLPLALQLMDGAAEIAEGVSLGISALDHARVLIEAGLSDAADDTLARATAEFQRGRLHQELAEAELARAECAVLADNLTRARRLAGSARTRFRRRGVRRWWRVAELTLLSADQAAGRPSSRLVGPALALAAEFETDRLDLQARAARLIGASALTGLGRIAEAGQQLDHVGPVARTDPIALRVQQRAVTAGWLLGAGDRRRARSEVRRGLAELSRHQAQFGSIDLQTASAIHGRRLVRLDLELAAAAGRPQGVFDAIERGRAVSRRLTAVTPADDESAGLLAELRQLGETLKAIGDDPAEVTAVTAMRHRVGELYRRLEAISWRAVGGGEVNRPASLGQVSEIVRAQGRLLVSVCQVGGRWTAVVLGRDRPELVQLPGDDRCLELSRRAQADLGVLAYATLPTALRDAVSTSLTRTLTLLDDALIRPLRLSDRPVVVVPTGPISTLPWSCLPSLRGRPVEVSPTATSWLAGATAEDLTGDLTVAALAGPGVWTGPNEVAAVAAAWAGQAAAVAPASGRAATRRTMARALADDTIVHVAAHGSHVRQNPLFSSLALDDGPLFAYELAPDRVAPHVVLSSCELGQATTRPGDEALGLTRVLLQLGAQCVVAGVAQVNDDQAAEVMAAYHRRLAAGEDSAAALAAATGTGPYAPFVCFGSSWSAT